MPPVKNLSAKSFLIAVEFHGINMADCDRAVTTLVEILSASVVGDVIRLKH